jgi:DNA-binding MarR family transcriptional regulator
MGDIRKTSHEIHILTSIIMKTARQSMEQCLSQQGTPMTLLQYGVLRLLFLDAFTLSEISRKMALDPSTLVPALDALERKGYIRRERDPSDRRRFPLHLTDDGKILLEQVQIAQEDDPIHRAVLALGEEDADLFRQLLRKFVVHLPDGEANLREIEERLIAQQANFSE